MHQGISQTIDLLIFDAKQFKDRLLLVGGGGGERYGLRNQILVLSGVTLATLASFDTQAVLFERLLVNEVFDYFLAVAEAEVRLFDFGAGGLIQERESLLFAPKPSAMPIIAALHSNTLIVSDPDRQFRLYEIAQARLHLVFSVEMHDRLLAIHPSTLTPSVVCAFDTRVLFFDITNKCFTA